MRKVSHTSEFPFGIYWWTLKNQKNQTFEKMKKKKKFLEISSFDTCVPKTAIIWCAVPKIQSETEFFVTLGHFFALLTPSPPNNPDNQNFEKMKKASGDVIILNLCNKKHDHMMYVYSDMECDRHNFLSFQAIFALLPH